MSLVSNTGPLIALAKIDHIRVLHHLAGEVHIPPMVYRELLAKTGVETARLDDALACFVQVAVRPQISATLEEAIGHLDAGEQEAIALAHAMDVAVVLDDRLGRKAARRVQVEVTGTAGVLVQAKHAGLIPLVRPLLQALRQQGYWLSDTVLEVATRLAGEET
jgi:predicted nucleic acid-binding protein